MTESIVTEEFRKLLDCAPGMYATSVSAENVPEVTRVLAARVEAGADVLRFVVATAFAERFLEDSRATGRGAMVACELTTYRTYQFKGRYVGTEAATAEDEAAVKANLDAFDALVTHVGIDPSRYRGTFDVAPYTALTLAVDAVFDQTPRVGAGALVSKREEAR